VPIEKFKANLERMVWMLHAPESEWYSPETRIILITPPPVNTHRRKADLESREPPQALDRLFDTTKEYAEVVKRVAQEKGVGVVDAWTALWEGAGKDEHALKKYLSDGLHLSEDGYEVIEGVDKRKCLC
jgi:isoamyl acetate esterase